ncbi:hypothetical protein PP707_03365 [Acetobacter pasteurianus]|nr:hypothetical protein [Acetobacter pasteurianus]
MFPTKILNRRRVILLYYCQFTFTSHCHALSMTQEEEKRKRKRKRKRKKKIEQLIYELDSFRKPK